MELIILHWLRLLTSHLSWVNVLHVID